MAHSSETHDRVEFETHDRVVCVMKEIAINSGRELEKRAKEKEEEEQKKRDEKNRQQGEFPVTNGAPKQMQRVN
ncbi:hypothetical protein KEM56_006632 [Ascosphaera pollenicola]|nr:hypothetical protein KEM56_006632 [Ascosphaera pollenicola]